MKHRRNHHLFGGAGWHPISMETGEEGLARAVIFKAIMDYRRGRLVTRDEMKLRKGLTTEERMPVYRARENFRDFVAADLFFFSPKCEDLLELWCSLADIKTESFRKTLKLWIKKDCSKPAASHYKKYDTI